MATQSVDTLATYQNLKFEREGTLAVVTLNRPSRRNALSLGLMTELIDCLAAIGRDKDLVAGVQQHLPEVFANLLVVIDNQHGG